MPNLKNRFVDQVMRLIRRHVRLEICAVDRVHWHEAPYDQKFNSVDVVMRDRAIKNATGTRHIRKQLTCLQSMVGHCLGYNWNPRKGDLVYVLFYGERKGVVLGSVWSWAEYPPCRATPYDVVEKGGQWLAPYQDEWKDFPEQPYPLAKKPYCFKWFHGPLKGQTGPGRDWCWLFDYCHEGHAHPHCELCKTIDSIGHILNHFFKFYSEQTESRKAYPLRGVYHNPSGSYWLFEGSDKPGEDYVSEFYTEGMGFWTLQGCTTINGIEYLMGHIRHSPDGTMEGHSATPAQDDSAGSRWKVYSPDNNAADEHGPIAADLQHLETSAVVRIYKDGAVRVLSATDPSGDAGTAEVFVRPDGNCWLWNIVSDAYFECKANGKIEIRSPSEVNIIAPVIKHNGAVIHS